MKCDGKKPNRSGFVLLAAVIGAILIVAGCDLLGTQMTIEQRIEAFESEINLTNRSEVYTHTHPDAQNHQGARLSTYWNTILPTADRPYTITIVDTDNVVVTASISGSGGQYNNTPIVFEMKEDGLANWKILIITIGDTVVFD